MPSIADTKLFVKSLVIKSFILKLLFSSLLALLVGSCSLTLSITEMIAGEHTHVTITLTPEDKDYACPEICLNPRDYVKIQAWQQFDVLEVNEAGEPLNSTPLAQLTDDGLNGDILAGDGVFSFSGLLMEPNAGILKLRALHGNFPSNTVQLTVLENPLGECGNEVGNGADIVSGPNGPDEEDHDSVFRAFAIHPNDADILMMGTERNGFVKSVDGGISWTRHRQGLRHAPSSNNAAVYPEIWDLSFNPTDPNILYAATLDSPGPVLGNDPSSIAGVYKSIDGGESWLRINCGLNNSRITSVSVDAANPDTVIIGVEAGEASYTSRLGEFFSGGLYRSDDGGNAWYRADIIGSAAQSKAANNGFWYIWPGAKTNIFFSYGFWSFQNSTMLNGEENVGLLKSSDGGSSWQPLGSAIQPLLITDFAVSSDGQTLYANERGEFRMHRSLDGGVTWTTTQIIQSNGPIAVSHQDAGLILYAGTNSLYRSTDGGDSVDLVLQASRSIHKIAFAPSDSTVVYVVTEGYLVYKSTDNGLNFSLVRDVRNDVLNVQP